MRCSTHRKELDIRVPRDRFLVRQPREARKTDDPASVLCRDDGVPNVGRDIEANRVDVVADFADFARGHQVTPAAAAEQVCPVKKPSPFLSQIVIETPFVTVWKALDLLTETRRFTRSTAFPGG